MKATELRIGNLVHPHGDKSKVDQIKTLGFTEYVDCSPIVLTQEWLLKFGAKEIKGHETKRFYLPAFNLKGELHFELFNNTKEIVSTLKSQFSDLILDRIYYVHQLQNLYFALTGEELTLKQ